MTTKLKNIIKNDSNTLIFKILDLNFIDKPELFEYNKLYDENNIKDCMVKTNIQILERDLHKLNINELKKDLEKHCKFVFPIVPKINKEKQNTNKDNNKKLTSIERAYNKIEESTLNSNQKESAKNIIIKLFGEN